MEAPIPPKFSAVFRVSFILVLLSSFALICIGHAVSSLHHENVLVEKFLSSADSLQINFEKSLSMYTENTQASMDYLDQLRPSDENGYIQFISTVETLGQEQGLEVELQTVDAEVLKPDDTGSHFIDYKIQFYAREAQIPSFLSALEALPYFTRVMDINYRSFEFYDSSKDSDTPNVVLTVRLYVK